MPTTKEQIARTVVREVKSLTNLVDSVPSVWQQYWDAVGGYGEYTDEELEPLGITLQQLLGCVTLLENLKLMVNNEAVATNTYRITINSVRHLQV